MEAVQASLYTEGYEELKRLDSLNVAQSGLYALHDLSEAAGWKIVDISETKQGPPDKSECEDRREARGRAAEHGQARSAQDGPLPGVDSKRSGGVLVADERTADEREELLQRGSRRIQVFNGVGCESLVEVQAVRILQGAVDGWDVPAALRIHPTHVGQQQRLAVWVALVESAEGWVVGSGAVVDEAGFVVVPAGLVEHPGEEGFGVVHEVECSGGGLGGEEAAVGVVAVLAVHPAGGIGEGDDVVVGVLEDVVGCGGGGGGVLGDLLVDVAGSVEKLAAEAEGVCRAGGAVGPGGAAGAKCGR